MAGHRTKATLLPALLAMVFAILVCIFAAPALAKEPPSEKPSQPDLICHTSNPDECYPRVFQPTDEFQVVHSDQEIPSGLHVRMNIWTGQKEAKINVPGEADASLEGLPVDQGVVVVDPQEQDKPRIPKDAPKYEAVGKVKGPEHESAAFYEGLKMLKAGIVGPNNNFDEALDGLEELSHDMYYGLKIAEDPEAVKSLFCIMSGPIPPSAPTEAPRDQRAAAILAGALQNNPAALKEIVKAWSSMADKSGCANSAQPLRHSVFGSVRPTLNMDGSPGDKAALRVKSKVAVINGLIKDDTMRAEFLSNGGMEALLTVLTTEGKDWAGAQRKVGQLVLDNFLDEDMGATLGQWPKVPKLDDKQCQTEASSTAEGCWDYHVARIMKVTKAGKGDWSRDLHDKLAAVRKQGNTGREHGEL